MKKRILGGLLAAMATAGCVTPAAQDPEALRLDVSEAVLRHMFRQYAGGNRRPVAYCLGVRPRFPGPIVDAPPALLRRLVDVRPAVKPYSGCVSRIEVLDAASGRSALIFQVGPTECPVPNRCTAMGGYTEGESSGKGSEYQLERHGNSWRVVSQNLRVVA